MRKMKRILAIVLLACLLGGTRVNCPAAAAGPAATFSAAAGEEPDEGSVLKGILLGAFGGTAAILAVTVGYRLGQRSVLGRGRSRHEDETDS